ncbi:MAG: wax ester/triacylglycerol synthase family O-acyltransferase [Actinophytocola sp.]|uniref:wax ester/triacylglycerol synthase family O-acyltransferase n=1 Tax=Actinophytocola sp. TaxID=1872138 RepID=UPI00132ADE7C|nr:wax ester/triacylglycerol synthase family O-acyltransferase [Actinophytocola sp.]MPZ85077.1 wax ester/triacylglycerol synthase family O-acyltransferase [Actinophytocola sp.]
MERLSPLDAIFLDAEDADPHVSMAIGAIGVLPGPVPSQAEFMAALVPRLRAVRRAQQRVRRLPFDLGPPVWGDLGHFDADYHFRRTALPAPGDDAALCALVARVMGQRLDRDRPLWESWVIEGLSGDRWAVLIKLHHCLADGMSGAQLVAALFATAPQPTGEPDWHAEPQPNTATLLWDAFGDITSNSLRVLSRALHDPKDAAQRVADTFAGLSRMSTALTPATPSSLTGPIGRSRRYAVARASLPDIRAIGATFGATVNDVALTAITLGYREVLRHRGERPDTDTLRAAVPVSIRATDNLDNQISVLLPTLPVEIADPVMALHEVHQRLADLKHSKEAEAATTVAALSGHEPFAFTTLAIRLVSRLPQRNIVTVTTNVPGPPTQLAMLGRPVLEAFPYVPIALRIRTGVAALSYHDQMTFGVTADFDSNPDVTLLTTAIERAIADLTAAAELHAEATSRLS